MNDKHILIVCPCSMRGNSIGLIKEFLPHFSSLKEEGYKVDLFDTNFFENHNPDNYKVDNYYALKIGYLQKLYRKLPFIRSWYAKRAVFNKYKELLDENQFCFIILYKVPPCVDKLVELSHMHKTKIALYPWGSEVLRASSSIEVHLKKAYSECDYAVGFEDSNLINKAKTIYKVSENRIREQKVFVKGVKFLMDLDKSISRDEMSNKVGITPSSYNIVCGYSGTSAQRHKIMIEAIAANRSFLPKDYQIVFPVTYVAQEAYIEELRKLCLESELNAIFLTEYLSDTQIAYLHLITDLYINIQQTDSGSAFMIESLFAGNQIVVGKWLKYEQFEEYGIPYHVIDDIEELPHYLGRLFRKEIPDTTVPQKLKDKYSSNRDFDLGAFWREMIEG